MSHESDGIEGTQDLSLSSEDKEIEAGQRLVFERPEDTALHTRTVADPANGSSQMELFVAPEPLIDDELTRAADEFSAHADRVQQESYLPSRAHETRSPNIVDAFLFGVLMILGLLITTGFLGVALHLHWFGMKSFSESQNDTRLALGSQLLIYLIGLAGAVPLFQMVWHKGFLDGVHWHGSTASRLRGRLIVTAVGCNLIAVVGNYLLPFPQHAPIDKLFSTTGDAWMLFVFGVTIAPFFEEMIFRGFLLPAMATAWDWSMERMTDRASHGVDAEGDPIWSGAAMVFAALVVSAPFALMHAAQVGNSWGPVSLLYCVSLVLCAVRLVTKSLAASTLVHAAYNFMLFSVMLVETGGFRHLDKM